MDKRGFHAESIVNGVDTTAADGKESTFNSLVMIIRMIVVIVAVASAWMAFAMPLLWWGIVGSLFGSVGLITLRSRFKGEE